MPPRWTAVTCAPSSPGWTAGSRFPPSRSWPAAPGRATELARNLLDGITATDERELSGIWSTASGALTGFRSHEALRATADPTFDPGRFVRSSDTIYIAAPAHRQSLVAPMVVGLLEDIRRAAYEEAACSRPQQPAGRSCSPSTSLPTSLPSPIYRP